jgi:glycosyltransferase involved in cell wall biosynthesis
MLARDGERIVSIGPPPKMPEPLRLGGVIHRPLGSSRLAGRRLAELAGRETILHVWSPSALPAALAATRPGDRKCVLSLACADDGHEHSFLDRFARRGAVVLTVPTESARKALLAGASPAGAVVVLPPAAQAPDDAPSRRGRTREQLGLTDEHCLIVAPGELTRSAGHRAVIWAMAILRQILPNVRLLVPGEGPARRNVQFFAETTGHGEDVFHTEGSIAPADALVAGDIAAFGAKTDCGVAALAGAMAAGLPVVAGDTPDVREMIDDGRTGLLCPPGIPRLLAAAILRLIDEPQTASLLAQAARGHAAEHWTPRACRQALEAIYTGLA